MAPDIGLHYFAAEKYGLFSRYSLGLSGIDPFVGARFNMPFKVKDWFIDLVENFKYSTDNAFEEETNIYFDQVFDTLSLFRIQLHRKTQQKVKGMDYALAVQYYWSPKKDTGFRLSQVFLGNTEYDYVADRNTKHSQTKSYSGINNYVTSLSWRKNIWRKWFYFEVQPAVNFHKQFDYEIYYSIRIFLDFYFGQCN